MPVATASPDLATRVRLRYAKGGRVRFVSAIDLGRIWERAVRRADLPIAYSEGFSPHPKISFVDALPLGYASTGEYAELTFAGAVHLTSAVRALDAAFPDGVRVVDARAADDNPPRFARLLQASCWDVAYPAAAGLDDAVARAREADQLVVDRHRKGEPVPVDLRPALASIELGGATVRAVLRHVEPAVRPSELHLALRLFLPSLPDPALVMRVAQGQLPDTTDDRAPALLEALSGEPVVRRPSLTAQRRLDDRPAATDRRDRRDH